MDSCTSDDIDGRQLWLGVHVLGDLEEMTPRQPIYPVPYAWSLRPGAIIEDATSHVKLNYWESFWKHGVYAEAYGTDDDTDYYGVYGYGSDYGVYGDSYDGTGVKGSSYNGEGVRAESTNGVAVHAISTNDTGV